MAINQTLYIITILRFYIYTTVNMLMYGCYNIRHVEMTVNVWPLITTTFLPYQGNCIGLFCLFVDFVRWKVVWYVIIVRIALRCIYVTVTENLDDEYTYLLFYSSDGLFIWCTCIHALYVILFIFNLIIWGNKDWLIDWLIDWVFYV